MKSKKTKKTVKAKKTKRTKKPLQTNAKYVYWYGCANPRFGLQLLKDPAAALKRNGFVLSADEMNLLAGFLDAPTTYAFTLRQLLEGVCKMKDREPKKGASTETTEVVPNNPAPLLPGGVNAVMYADTQHPAPPPWG